MRGRSGQNKVVCPFRVKRRPSGAVDLGLFDTQQRTSEDGRSRSEKCQQQTHAPQQMASQFDQPVGKLGGDVTAHRVPKAFAAFTLIPEIREFNGEVFNVG